MPPQQRKQQQPAQAEILTRALPGSEPKVDLEARTLSFTFSSTRPVERYAWFDDELPEGASHVFDEVLSHDPAHWRLERVTEKVCPYLKNHNRDKKLGQVLSVEFSGDRGVATVKLRRSPEADQHLKDIEDGTAGSGVSFGYKVYKYRVLAPAEYEGEGWFRRLSKKAVLESIDTEIFECSSEEIPADPSVGYGKSAIDLRTIAIEGDPAWEKTEQEIETVPPKRKETTPNQKRELMFSDYMTADSPTTEDVVKGFQDTIAAIESAAQADSTIDKTKLTQSAIEDMCSAMYGALGVPDPDAGTGENEPTTPPIMTGTKTEDTNPTPDTRQDDERDRRYREMEARVQLMERREAVTTRYNTLRQKGEALKSQGKLTPAEFNAKFGDPSAAIDMYVKASDEKLNGLEERLNDIEAYAVPVEPGSKLAGEPLEQETRSQYDDELDGYLKTRKR